MKNKLQENKYWIGIIFIILIILLVGGIIYYKMPIKEENETIKLEPKIEIMGVFYPKFHSDICGDIPNGTISISNNEHTSIYLDERDCKVKSITFRTAIEKHNFNWNNTIADYYILDNTVEMYKIKGGRN